MGKRGPAPKPTAVKVLHGTFRADRANPNEPKPEISAPDCPAWLGPIAAEEWRRVVPELEKLGLLAKVDRAALAAYCDAWGVWQRAAEIVEREGLTVDYETKTGGLYVQQRAEVSIAERARKDCVVFAREFGLSPSSRTKVAGMKPEKAKDEWD